MVCCVFLQYTNHTAADLDLGGCHVSCSTIEQEVCERAGPESRIGSIDIVQHVLHELKESNMPDVQVALILGPCLSLACQRVHTSSH